ncbi:MAG TPA: acyltransferase [Anaeromyxobacteraceae bacterium]|nr:acyltransferase [Anaeromyxobacteraceae bacterium]
MESPVTQDANPRVSPTVLHRIHGALAVARAKLLFFGCTQGYRIHANGYVRIVREGTIAIGDRVTFASGMLAPEVLSHRGAHLAIGPWSFVGYGASIEAWESIVIGRKCMIAPFARIEDRSFRKRGGVRIGDDVWIARNAVIEAGVSIGDGSVVAAGSVVTADVPPDSLAIGTPARCARLSLWGPPAAGTAPAAGAGRPPSAAGK